MTNNFVKRTISILGAGIMTLSLGIMITSGTLNANAQTNPTKITLNGNFKSGAFFSDAESPATILFSDQNGKEFALTDVPVNSPVYNTIIGHRLGWFNITGEATFQPITLQGGAGTTKIDYRISSSSKITPVDIGLGKLLVVNAPKGVIVRNSKCAKVGTQGYAYAVSLQSNKTINCTVNGKTFKMTQIENIYGTVNADNSDLFIASQFLSPLITNYNFNTDQSLTKYKVNNKAGLNLRDVTNCKRKATVANGTILNQPTGGMGGSIAICKVGNQFYEMTYVSYQGKNYQVAMALVTNTK